MYLYIYNATVLPEGARRPPRERPNRPEFSICTHTLVSVLKPVFVYKFHQPWPTAIDFEGARVARTNSSRNLLIRTVLAKYPEVQFIRYFYTSPDVGFARVPNLLTKITPVRGTYLPNPPSIFADGDGDAADRGLLGATARFSMPLVDPTI